MSFCGYKYRFGLYAAHSNIGNSNQDTHYHNFTITLYINTSDHQSDDNFNVEKTVEDWLKQFQGQQLPKVDLFRGLETTVEGMGNTFFDPLYDLIDQLGFELVRLDIYENPIRVFSVSKKLLDSMVNEIHSIPVECLPILQIEDPEEIAIDAGTEAEQEVAATVEVGQEVAGTVEAEQEVAATVEVGQEVAPTMEVLEKDALQEGLHKVRDEIIKIPGEKQQLNEDSQSQENHETTENLRLMENHEPTANNKSRTNKNKNCFPKVLVASKLLIGLCCFIVLAGITMYFMKLSGQYPQGSDTFCHLYRADLILQNMMEGNWFPLYDSKWYNGVEIMRYWGPLPLYLIAGLEWMVHSSILDAYVVFLGFLIVLGGCGWLLWGYRYQRIGLSIILGLLWFFMPENIRVVVYEGNLPRGVINALLPFFFFFLVKVMEDKKRRAIYPLILVTMLITLSHLGITLMLLVTTAIFVVCYAKMNAIKTWSWSAYGTTVAGVLLTGLWVVPALIGGAASTASTNQVMKNFFESAMTSLNPFLRFEGDAISFYFGLSIFILCLLGIMFGSKKVKAGFITALILYVCTTKSMYELFSKLPFSQFLWMIRLIPIGLAAALASFLMWKQLKKWMVALLTILILMDCVTSFQYIYQPGQERIVDVQANLEERAQNLLITEAKDITKQRLAIMDLSKYGAFAPYYVAGVGNPVNYTFGAGWEGSSTASNIVNLNTAMENGWYVYLFDRALGLGNDTVLIPIANLKNQSNDVEIVKKEAKLSGYELVQQNPTSLLFHQDTDNQFGVITEYKKLAIGKSASGIAMIFPSFEEGSKHNINAYTFEELSKYETIYLSGFTYDNQAKAEELLLHLSQSGVDVYIDMNSVPIDKVKKQMELFGVKAQTISFTDTLPEFTYGGTKYQGLDFTYGTGEWNTVYLIGLDQIMGTASVTQKDIPYIGTSKNDHLHFVGLNIIYYVQTTKDTEISKLVESIFGIDKTALPSRNLVPIRISTADNQIEIYSDYDNVSTTIAQKDIFSSDENYRIKDNLIMVDRGSTILNLSYPHVGKGIMVTAMGLILTIFIYFRLKNTKEEPSNEKDNK